MKAVAEALSGMLTAHESHFKLLLGARGPTPRRRSRQNASDHARAFYR